MDNLKRTLVGATKRFLKEVLVERREIRLRTNNPRGRQGKALLLYLNEWWLPQERLRKMHSHQNMHQSRTIAQGLLDLGYDCDVVHYGHKPFVAQQQYDVIISHRADPDFLNGDQQDRAYKIFLASTQPPWINNDYGSLRTAAVRANRGQAVEGYRLIPDPTPFLEVADAVCCFGEASVARAWAERFEGPVLPFNNWAFELPSTPQRHWESARRSVFYYASATQVHKGLDLVLEVARRRRDQNFLVCSYYEREKGFCSAFEDELFRTPNVNAVGSAVGSSAMFQALAAKSAFSVLPSVGEGSPGSLMETAATGLVPIISRYCGVDWPEAIYIEELSIGGVEQALAQALDMDRSEWEDRSAAIALRVRREYTPAAFDARWREILNRLLGVDTLS